MKKIGVFISHIFGDYQKNVCQGIIDKALEYGYHVEIFETMDGENVNADDTGEQSILHIPYYEELSGVIFASDTYPLTQLRNTIAAALEADCTCPVIEITVTDSVFPAVTLENNSTAGKLTDHLIEHHHYKRICYLGCSSETFFSDQRREHYSKSMQAHDLTVHTNDICDATYDEASVSAALDYFLEKGEKPDAVVCYNDRIALLLMNALLAQGYHIPEDIAITGCDMTDGGQQLTTPLTSVTYPVYELGICAVTKLIDCIHKRDTTPRTIVTASCCLRRTCGCECDSTNSTIPYETGLRHRIERLEISILDSMRMSASFQHINDIDDGCDLLEHYIKRIEQCSEFYLCLNSNWDSIAADPFSASESSSLKTEEADDDQFLLKFALRGGKRLPECSFHKGSPLPAFLYSKTPSVYVFTPLFFDNKAFGYIAIAYDNQHINYHFQLVQWIQNINQLLQSICDQKRRGELVEKLTTLYTRDALTGLYNQYGYRTCVESFLADAKEYNKSLTCFVFDLDCLKNINDNYGHAQGDFALQVVGRALLNEQNASDIGARFSGDEFYLLSSSYTKDSAVDLLSRVDKYLKNYSQLSNKEYVISACAGFARSDASCTYTPEYVQALFALADQQMYEAKKSKRS